MGITYGRNPSTVLLTIVSRYDTHAKIAALLTDRCTNCIRLLIKLQRFNVVPWNSMLDIRLIYQGTLAFCCRSYSATHFYEYRYNLRNITSAVLVFSYPSINMTSVVRNILPNTWTIPISMRRWCFCIPFRLGFRQCGNDRITVRSIRSSWKENDLFHQ